MRRKKDAGSSDAGRERAMKNTPGFTFVEAVMVILLLVVLAVVAYPRFAAVDTARVNGAAMVIAADIRYTQSLAITTRVNHRIVFSSSTNSYIVERDNAGTWQTATHPAKGGNFYIALHDDFPGVVLNSSYTIEFNYLGEPVVGGGGSFVISYGGSSPAKTISIVANTGRVRVT